MAIISRPASPATAGSVQKEDTDGAEQSGAPHQTRSGAAAHEEWADFFEWRLEQQADELADDPVERHLMARWTDSMAYCCRRLATFARGGDPGEAVPQHVRRPDLGAEGAGQGTAGKASSKIAPASSAL